VVSPDNTAKRFLPISQIVESQGWLGFSAYFYAAKPVRQDRGIGHGYPLVQTPLEKGWITTGRMI
jgi:hypothetical protein